MDPQALAAELDRIADPTRRLAADVAELRAETVRQREQIDGLLLEAGLVVAPQE